MSAKYMKLIVEDRGQDAEFRIPEFIALLKKRDHDGLEALVADLWPEDGEPFGRDLIDFEGMKKADGLLVIEVQASTFLDDEAFETVLKRLGAQQFEISVYNSQVGEYAFINEDGFYYDYKDAEWRWLENPEPDFEGEVVVATGTLKDYDAEVFKDEVECYGGSVAESVSSDTTMLIVGKKPDAEEQAKAEELGIRCLTEKEFDKLLMGPG